MKKIQNGFTLVELLVVIAIIGILASIIMASLSTAKAKGRDGKRLSDIKQIQLALELYDDACGNFPVTIYGTSGNVCNAGGSSPFGLVAGGYITTVPTDPSGSVACTDGSQNSCYTYVGLCAGASCAPTSYHLGTTLETADVNLSQDADACIGTPVGSATNAGQPCPSGNGVHDTDASNQGSAADFSGISYAAGGSQCNSTAGNPYPSGTHQETCYDVKP